MKALSCTVTNQYQGPKQGLNLPTQDEFSKWACASLLEFESDTGLVLARAVISIILLDESSIQTLNARYRQRIKPTNTLSFPYEIPNAQAPHLSGEIFLCVPVIVREAQEQAEEIKSHWAYLTIHSVLHLCGYEHVQPGEAAKMEALEQSILEKIR